MIMGYSAIGSEISNNGVSEVQNITTFTLSNSIYDEFYVTAINETVKPPDQILPPDEWDGATYIYAKFNGDMYAGNADFSVQNTTNVLIKRRKKGEFKWFTLYDIPANNADDYEFTVIDPYAPKGWLEYAAVPIVNGYENEYNISEIYYDFDGLILIEKDRIIQTILDISISEEKNGQVGIANTLYGKYPYVFYNGENDYFTGTVSATYIDLVNYDAPEKDVLHNHYQEVLNFLNNKKAKILKYQDGRIRLISITQPPADSSEEHWDKHTIEFGYTEIGDVYSNEDMNNYGFLNVGEEWWTK